MGKITLTFCRTIVFYLTLHGAFFSIGRAQVVIAPDGSMGTQVIQNGNTHNITGGTRPGGGGNLFHSFGEFGVPTNNIANFLNDSGLPTSNILSRVTGGNPSNILGTIQTEGFGNANLFLMNPAGIVFGPNASLNVGGATHFTTADYLQLADGVQFTALPSAQDALLSVAPVAAFGFLESNPASLTVDRSMLSVGEGEVLSLVGGDIDISGGTLKSQDGQINLVSLNSPGTVNLGEDGGLQVNASQRGRIELSENASINVDGESGGTIVIRGGNLMVEGSQISANVIGSSEGGMAGVTGYSIDIEVSEDVVLDNQSKIAADVSGSRDGKDIRVMAGKTLEIRNSVLRTATFADGNAGNLEVQADKVLFNMDSDGPGFDIFGISSLTLGSGNSGGIQLKAGNLQMFGGQLTTVTLQAAGQAGNVELMVENDISVMGRPEGGGFIGANALFGSGNAGDILITANNLTMSGPANMQAVTALGQGNAGNITINLQGNFDLSETASIDNFTDRSGAAGNISITAKNIFLTGVENPVFPTGQTSIGASSTDGGPGGNINITAEDRLVIDRGILITRTTGSGVGGNINASAGNLIFTNGTSVTAESTSISDDAGNAGNIQIMADDTVLIAGSSLLTKAEGTGAGGAMTVEAHSIELDNATLSASVKDGVDQPGGPRGDISLTTPTLLMNGGEITAETSGTRSAGSITLNTDTLLAQNAAKISALTSADGGAGTISITTGSLNMTDGATINSGTTSTGAGGEISLMAGQNFTLSDGATVSARSDGPGNAGEIGITAGAFTITHGGRIDSGTTNTGQGGSINVNASGNLSIAGTLDDGTPSGVFSQTTGTEPGSGSGGEISLMAGQNFTLSDGATVSASSDGPADAGDIHITANDTILIDQATVTTDAEQAQGGNLKLTANEMIQLVDSTIESSVRGGAGTVGGNINLDPDFIILRNSNILTTAQEGDGGNISLIANEAVLVDSESNLDVSSLTGRSGSIRIESPIQVLSGAITPLPSQPINVATLYASRCVAGEGGHFSTFVDSKTDSIAPAPGTFLASPFLPFTDMSQKRTAHNPALSSESTQAGPEASIHLVAAYTPPVLFAQGDEMSSACP